jgi:aryl-alcohol dehydrogenase-like predicted oxidoreductase
VSFFPAVDFGGIDFLAIFCVPGTTKIAHFEQNYAARDIHLTAEDLRRIDEVFSINAPVGERYGGNHFTFHEN